MRRLLLWLSARLPLRIISEGDKPYLERYYVCSAAGLRVYLHRFVASDPDRGLHDHPWKWAVSIILAGWYVEERRDGDHVRSWLNFLVGDNFHRVVLPAGGGADVWTVFIHRAGKRKPWGFLRGPDETGVLTFHEFQYTGGEKSEERKWWLDAPLGRDEPRRITA